MWLLKNIQFNSNGINPKFRAMLTFMGLESVKLEFANNKVLKFNFNILHSYYKPIKVIKHFLRPIRMMDWKNTKFYEYDESKVLNTQVYLTCNNREYSHYAFI